MAERENGDKIISIPDNECEAAGCSAAWGLGNQLFIFAGTGVPQTDQPSGLTIKRGPFIHEVQWDTDMHKPVTRQLVNETYNIFMNLQAFETKGTSKKSQMVKFSREYRSVIKACVIGLHSSLKSGLTEREQRQLEAQLDMLEMMELVWNLCEILFVDILPGGMVVNQLLDWLRLHFVEGDRMAQESRQQECPEEYVNYWDAIYSFVLQGRVTETRHLLSLHSSHKSEAFLLMDQLLQRMPLFTSFAGQSLGEFEMKWRHWQEECAQMLEQGHFAAEYNLETICRILCGQDDAFLELRDLIGSWYCMLIGRLLYQNPTVKAFDLQYHTQFCIDAYGGNIQMQAWDNILLAAIEFDIHQVIKECSNLGNWWFVGHLTDLLHHCGQLDTQPLYLWQLAVGYFDHCPEFGRGYLNHFIERLPLDSERKANKIIRMCEDRDMLDQIRSICKVMGMKALHGGHLGSALVWGLRSKDIGFSTFLAESFLNEYSASGGFSNLDLIDNLGPSMLLSGKLTFLVKYREFHKMYEDEDFMAAASLLLSLLTSDFAPKKFWLTLLTDALPMLEGEKVIFGSEQTYELMRYLEGLGINQKIDSKTNPDNDISTMQDPVETEKLGIMKLALARNLSRAIVQEGTAKAL